MKMHQKVSRLIKGVKGLDALLIRTMLRNSGREMTLEEIATDKRRVAARCNHTTDQRWMTTDRSKVTCLHCLGRTGR